VATGVNAGGIASGGIAAIAGMVPSKGGKGAQIAAQSLFTAASAANAIPVAGQFVSAGLAIAGLFTKIFGGQRKEKRRKRREARAERLAKASEASPMQSGGAGGVGLAQSGQSQIATAPVAPPIQPAFSSYGGGAAPSVQPTQQAINSSLGFK